jgi:GNAT superfamily N-acetyltransferase
MIIRAATPDNSSDLDALLATAYAPVMARMQAGYSVVFAELLPKARARYAEQGVWFVAESGAELLGCVAYFKPGAIQHPHFQDKAHIQLLGVAPANTRKGVGRRLMAHCQMLAKQDGANEFLLQTSELMPEARGLYESMGLTVRGHLPMVWGKPTYLYAMAF